MYQNILGQQDHLYQRQRGSPDNEQTSMPPTSGRRRSSLWDRFTSSALHASQADMHGFQESTAEGFAPAGAKFDETFGNSALFETGFEWPHRDQSQQRERLRLSEDALRQMS
ncbi:hypothetical protein BX666DRAFT_2029388 [Dichotomocladium elegans]|nr:hypothetical protein BX666DRAFT_2029388 [Dichotomocladium elegans]